MSDIIPTGAASPARATGTGYRDVQHRLAVLAQAMDDACDAIDECIERTRRTGAEAAALTKAVAHAQLDPAHIELTGLVEEAQRSALPALRLLAECAQDVALEARNTRAAHRKMYGELDAIRTGRRERTPKPGFFAT